jgi:hypothetical protein
VLALTAALASAPAASADLRSPPLQSNCPSGYSYDETEFGLFVVEGCQKIVPVANDCELARREYTGNLELNGLRVETTSGNAPLVATARKTGKPSCEPDGPNGTTGRIKRGAPTTLKLDPLIGGQRRQIPFYLGSLDLEATRQSLRLAGRATDSRPSRGQPASTSPGAARPVASSSQFDLNRQDLLALGYSSTKIDIPIGTGGAVPKILGLPLQEAAPATVKTSGLVFTATLTLGDSAPAPLRGWTGKAKIELVDGQGMKLQNLIFKIPRIQIPGIGGLRNLRVEYSAVEDTWDGSVILDLGELFPEIDFHAIINASTGAPEFIRAEASNLGIPIGSTGIVLQSVGMEFTFNPFIIGVDASATAGPVVLGNSLILLDGSLVMRFEPNFRLEVEGNARILPTGPNSQLATGTVGIIYDSQGLISIAGNAQATVAVSGIGASVTVSGEGAYSSTSNRFNIYASASGNLLLGEFGTVNVAQIQAALSSKGWGACTKILFVKVGMGQKWGQNPKLIGCDLSPYRVNVASAAEVRAAQNGFPSRSFQVRPGTKRLGMRLTADAPGPRVRMIAPNGATLETTPGQRGPVGNNLYVASSEETPNIHVFARNPRPGTYRIEWPANGPQITRLELATEAPKLQARARVTKPAMSRKGSAAAKRSGRRVVQVQRRSPLAPGDQLEVGIRSPQGITPLGEPTTRRSFSLNYEEFGPPGPRQVVARVVRDGVPLPDQQAVIGRYSATYPSATKRIGVCRKNKRLKIRARQQRGSEPPEAWQYKVAVSRRLQRVFVGGPNRPLTIPFPPEFNRVAVAARPMLSGRGLPGTAKAKKFKRIRPCRS